MNRYLIGFVVTLAILEAIALALGFREEIGRLAGWIAYAGLLMIIVAVAMAPKRDRRFRTGFRDVTVKGHVYNVLSPNVSERLNVVNLAILGVWIVILGGLIGLPTVDWSDSSSHTDETSEAHSDVARTVDSSSWSESIDSPDVDSAKSRIIPVGGSIETRNSNSQTWPSGEVMAFSLHSSGLPSFITIVDPESKSSIHMASDHLRFAASPDWSPDGSRLAFSCAFTEIVEVGTSICSVDRESNGISRLSDPPGDDGSASDSAPVWAPDGSMIAFVRGGNVRSTVIVIRDTGEKIIEVDGRKLHGWSPDNSMVAVDDRLVDLDGDVVFTLPTGGGIIAFSPDGRSVYYSNQFRAHPKDESQIQELFRVDLISSEESRITYGVSELQGEGGSSTSFGSLSPDGNYVPKIVQGNLYLIATVGSEMRSVATQASSIGDWSPDSSYLAYLLEMEDTKSIAVAHVLGESNSKLVDVNGSFGGLTWAVSGSRD